MNHTRIEMAMTFWRPVVWVFVLGFGSLLWIAASPAQPAPVRPGPEHKALKTMEGTWDAVFKLPGGIKSKGTMTSKVECGGLWLVRNLETKLGGVRLEIKELEGFDPVTKRHITIQVDSMTTVPMRLEGAYDEAAKALIQTGETRDFDGKPELVKSISKAIDEDHHVVEVYRVYPDKTEKKHLTIEYTRRKKAE